MREKQTLPLVPPNGGQAARPKAGAVTMSYGEQGVLIVGCGGHARVVTDIARAAGVAVQAHLDDMIAEASAAWRVVGPIREKIRELGPGNRFIVAIGDNAVRRELSELVLRSGGDLMTLVHPAAVIAPDVAIGAGSVIMAGAIVNTGSTIGRFAVINTGATVDHDNRIGDNVHISPGCHFAGTVTCGADAFIGTGAVVIPGVSIGEGAYVAAGATVINDVPARTLVAGCPAVVKRPA